MRCQMLDDYLHRLDQHLEHFSEGDRSDILLQVSSPVV